MFEGSSAQMLCVLETLTDSNRRTLLSAPPAAENEVEILDVYAELFMAAQELIAGQYHIAYCHLFSLQFFESIQ